jgi:hypothetical protein
MQQQFSLSASDDLFVGEELHDTRWPIFDTKRLSITPKSARAVYDAYQFSRQRRISKDHVAKYAAAMEAGTFKPHSTVTVAQAPNGQKWIVDGNHTLRSVEAYGHPFPLTIEFRHVADEEDAAILYSTFEARKRSLADHMVAANLSQSIGVSPSMLSRFTPGIHLLELDIPERLPRLVDVAYRQKLVEMWAEQCPIVKAILADAPSAKIMGARAACIALIFLTVKHQPEKAVQFWRPIALAANLSPGSPQYTAWSTLGSPTAGQLAPEQFKRLALCWNAWFNGTEEFKLTKIFAGQIYVTVAGTDWVNRKTGGFKVAATEAKKS